MPSLWAIPIGVGNRQLDKQIVHSRVMRPERSSIAGQDQTASLPKHGRPGANQSSDPVLLEVRLSAEDRLHSEPVRGILHQRSVPGCRLAEDFGMAQQQGPRPPPGLGKPNQQASIRAGLDRIGTLDQWKNVLEQVLFLAQGHIGGVIGIPWQCRECRQCHNKAVPVGNVQLPDFLCRVAPSRFGASLDRKHVEGPHGEVDVLAFRCEDTYGRLAGLSRAPYQVDILGCIEGSRSHAGKQQYKPGRWALPRMRLTEAGLQEREETSLSWISEGGGLSMRTTP